MLALKRIVLLFLLVGSIAMLAWVQFVTASDDSESIARLMVNRKQKTDYKNLFNDSLFKTFTIEFDETVFSDMISSMQAYFDEYGTYQDNTMFPVNVYYSDGNGTSFSIQEVGFRTKSNTSRNLPMTTDWMNRTIYHQTSFQLQFDATFDYDENSNEYAVLKTREAFNLDQINFEYCKSFDGVYDKAMISEAFSYYLYDQAGVITSNASYGLVYFKIGETLVGFGFYSIIEPIDNEFLKKNFDSDAIGDYGDLYKSTDIQTEATLSGDISAYVGINENEINEKYTYALKNNTLGGTRTIHSALTSLVSALEDPVYFSEHASEYVDVDQFLRYLAMGFLIGNTDDYRYNYNNYYLYFEVYTDVAVMIPFDLDNSLGFGKSQDVTGNYAVYYDLYSDTDDSAALIHAIFQNPAYVAQYEAYLYEFATTVFDYDVFLEAFYAAKDNYETILVEENHLGNQAFTLRNTYWYFTTKQEVVLSLLAQ